MSEANKRPTFRAKLNQSVSEAVDTWLARLFVPVVISYLQKKGITEVTADELHTLLEGAIPAPAAAAASSSAAASSTASSGSKAPRSKLDPATLRAMTRADFDDKFNASGCLYAPTRGKSPFVYHGGATTDGRPACQSCARKEEGKTLMKEFGAGTFDAYEYRARVSQARIKWAQEQLGGKAPVANTAGPSKTTPEKQGNPVIDHQARTGAGRAPDKRITHYLLDETLLYSKDPAPIVGLIMENAPGPDGKKVMYARGVAPTVREPYRKLTEEEAELCRASKIYVRAADIEGDDDSEQDEPDSPPPTGLGSPLSTAKGTAAKPAPTPEAAGVESLFDNLDQEPLPKPTKTVGLGTAAKPAAAKPAADPFGDLDSLPTFPDSAKNGKPVTALPDEFDFDL